eukprot:880962-Rhodomonas_salina.3
MAVQNVGLRVQGSGFRVQGSEFRVQGFTVVELRKEASNVADVVAVHDIVHALAHRRGCQRRATRWEPRSPEHGIRCVCEADGSVYRDRHRNEAVCDVGEIQIDLHALRQCRRGCSGHKDTRVHLAVWTDESPLVGAHARVSAGQRTRARGPSTWALSGGVPC